MTAGKIQSRCNTAMLLLSLLAVICVIMLLMARH